MSFLEAPALMGLLTGSTKHCPNLINTPMLAKEANLSVTQRYELSTDNSVSLSLKCTSGSFSVSGNQPAENSKTITHHYHPSKNCTSFTYLEITLGCIIRRLCLHRYIFILLFNNKLVHSHRALCVNAIKHSMYQWILEPGILHTSAMLNQ